MKNLISFICTTILLLSLSVTVFAGSVPEDLLHYDGAQIFFGEIISYTENGDVAVSPVKKIKGDINRGTKQTYSNANAVGDIGVKPGNVYLFTYFDENNPTDIFEATSYDTKTLKLKNVEGDMWERFEKNLNNGEYERAEQKRIDRLNEKFVFSGEQITLSEHVGADRDLMHTTVSFYSGPDAFEVEKEAFLEIADSITLHKIEAENVQIENWHGIYLSATENSIFTYISSDGKVSRNNPTDSGVIYAEYIIKAEDMSKLDTLVPDEACNKLPPLKNLPANILYWIIDNPTAAKVIGLLIIAGLMGVVAFIIGYKIRKKKGNNR